MAFCLAGFRRWMTSVGRGAADVMAGETWKLMPARVEHAIMFRGFGRRTEQSAEGVTLPPTQEPRRNGAPKPLGTLCPSFRQSRDWQDATDPSRRHHRRRREKPQQETNSCLPILNPAILLASGQRYASCRGPPTQSRTACGHATRWRGQKMAGGSTAGFADALPKAGRSSRVFDRMGS